MPWHDVDRFLEEVCKYVKYKGAHADISEELQNHIEDRIHDFKESGMDDESAIKKAVEAMGDPAEIGTSLNKLHKPYLGWILSITNTLILLAILYAALLLIPRIRMTFDSFNSMPKKDYVKYSIIVNEKAKIDDRTVVIKEVVVAKNNKIYIRYNDYYKLFSQGWAMLDFQVNDDKGNTYFLEEIQSYGGIFSRRYLRKYNNLDENATKIILNYNYYNRRMRFEIPINGGGSI